MVKMDSQETVQFGRRGREKEENVGKDEGARQDQRS